MFYDELEKLNELRQKGIITEDEFKTEKEKLYIQRDKMSQQQHSNKKPKNNSYIIWTGIISILLSISFLLNYDAYELGDTMLMFVIPGIFTLISGILKLCSKNNRLLLRTAGILILVGLISNAIAVLNLSIYGIYAIITSIFDFKYSSNNEIKEIK